MLSYLSVCCFSFLGMVDFVLHPIVYGVLLYFPDIISLPVSYQCFFPIQGHVEFEL